MVTKPAEKHMQFGTHFIFDGYGADKNILRDRERLRVFLSQLTADLHMHSLHEPVVAEVGPNNKKDPGGISGFVMIAESHISVHTFPNRGFITADVYTCQNELDTQRLTSSFVEHFQIKDFETHTLPRGTRYPVEDIQTS